MKNLLIIIAMLTTQIAVAQRNSVAVNYGILTTDEVMSTIGEALTAPLQNYSIDNLRSTGAIGFSYHRLSESRRLGYGATVVYDNLRGDVYNETNQKEGTKKITAITIAAEGKFKYTRGEKFNIYGLLGAGYTIASSKYDTNPQITDDFNYNHFNFQVTPLGIEYGTQIKGLLELGVGYKGIASAGVRYNF